MQTMWPGRIVEIENLNTFRPSTKSPAYVCTNRKKGCSEKLCFLCAKKLMLNDNTVERKRCRNK